MSDFSEKSDIYNSLITDAFWIEQSAQGGIYASQCLFIDRVMHPAPGAPGANVARIAQHAQMVRHQILRQLDVFFDFADALLATRQKGEDFEPVWLAHQLEQWQRCVNVRITDWGNRTRDCYLFHLN